MSRLILQTARLPAEPGDADCPARTGARISTRGPPPLKRRPHGRHWQVGHDRVPVHVRRGIVALGSTWFRTAGAGPDRAAANQVGLTANSSPSAMMPFIAVS